MKLTEYDDRYEQDLRCITMKQDISTIKGELSIHLIF